MTEKMDKKTHQNMTERVLKVIDRTFRPNADKTFKETFLSEYCVKVFSHTQRELNVRPLFSKSTNKTIIYSFAVFDGLKSVAIGHAIFKKVDR